MTTRRLTRIQKENIAARQYFKCAQSVHNYNCPIWAREEHKGSFGPEKYQIDHIIELWEGGTDDESNLQALCLSCHRVKTDRNVKIINYQQLNIISIMMLVYMMCVKFLIVQNNLYIDGLNEEL